MQNQYKDAESTIQQAKRQFEGLGDRMGAAQCLQTLGDICRVLNQPKDATVMLQQAKEQFEGVGHRLAAAQCLQSLGNICWMHRQYDKAKDMLQHGRVQFEELGHWLEAAHCMCSLGIIDHKTGHILDAIASLKKAKEYIEATQMPQEDSVCVNFLQRINAFSAVLERQAESMEVTSQDVDALAVAVENQTESMETGSEKSCQIV
ncbi:hypothetical protein D9758_018035 [Tetrapyrgos nigripes]|uniref:TPR-like protein n=1 Tax=Tetrapyrgos nigripes TaxID=182062 RepID=A0A8H5CBH7_9AGAR|nr:hypothetical protein D9758_018035 [Tetrapyrgos nigripes]